MQCTSSHLAPATSEEEEEDQEDDDDDDDDDDEWFDDDDGAKPAGKPKPPAKPPAKPLSRQHEHKGAVRSTSGAHAAPATFLPNMVRRSKKPKKAAGANSSFRLWFLRCCKAFSAVPLGLVKGPGGFAVTKQILFGVDGIQRYS